MDFPKRTIQQKTESESFAILLYRLKDVGIFRNMTTSDYGIDFEIEIVEGDKVIGKTIKAQCKSSSDLNIRQDGVPTVGGIKQTTLLYWIELSYSTPIIAFAVDVKTEKIYVSEPLFWQATSLLDKGDSTKTIEFRAPFDLSEIKKMRIASNAKIMTGFEDHLHTLLIKQYARGYSMTDVINAHKILLKNIKMIFQLYTDVWHYDHGSEVFEISTFNLVLEYGKILIGSIPQDAELTEQERANLYRHEYWASRSDLVDDDVQNYIARIPLKTIMSLLLDALVKYNNLVLKGKYYWFHKNKSYLKMAYQSCIPECRSHDDLREIDYEGFEFVKTNLYIEFLME